MESGRPERLDRLEKTIHKLLPGWRETSSWWDQIRYSYTHDWTWRTELVHPRNVNKWVTVNPGYYFGCKCWCNIAWKKYREDAWKNTFWTAVPVDPKSGWYAHYQEVYDPDLPAEDESLDLFRNLLATVPPNSIEWAIAYTDFFGDRLGDSAIDFQDSRRYEISHIALEFIILQHKIGYWKNRLGEKIVAAINRPQWAIDADERRDNPSEFARKKLEEHRAEHFPTRHELLRDFLKSLI